MTIPADSNLSPTASKPSDPATQTTESQTLAPSRTPIRLFRSKLMKVKRFLNLGKARWTAPVAEEVTTAVSSHDVNVSITELSMFGEMFSTATRIGGALKLPRFRLASSTAVFFVSRTCYKKGGHFSYKL